MILKIQIDRDFLLKRIKCKTVCIVVRGEKSCQALDWCFVQNGHMVIVQCLSLPYSPALLKVPVERAPHNTRLLSLFVLLYACYFRLYSKMCLEWPLTYIWKMPEKTSNAIIMKDSDVISVIMITWRIVTSVSMQMWKIVIPVSKIIWKVVTWN